MSKTLLENKYKMVLDENRSLIAIQGPKSAEILDQIIINTNALSFMTGGWFKYEKQNIFITRSGYTGEDGFEVSVGNELAEKFTKELINKGAKLIGLGARDTLRLEAGLCLYGHDINEETSPIEANLKWAISKNRVNENFPGVEKIKSQLNNGVKKLRVGIKPNSKIIAREFTKIFDKSNNEIGAITSGTFGPSVKAPIAMGYVSNEFSKNDTEIFLEVRGKKISANVCKLPFYKKSYVKGSINV